jgi:hypothetical protein
VGGDESLHQPVEVVGAQLERLVHHVEEMEGVRFTLWADVTFSTEGRDSDDVWVVTTGNVTGETSVTASLSANFWQIFEAGVSGNEAAGNDSL